MKIESIISSVKGNSIVVAEKMKEGSQQITEGYTEAEAAKNYFEMSEKSNTVVNTDINSISDHLSNINSISDHLSNTSRFE